MKMAEEAPQHKTPLDVVEAALKSREDRKVDEVNQDAIEESKEQEVQSVPELAVEVKGTDLVQCTAMTSESPNPFIEDTPRSLSETAKSCETTPKSAATTLNRSRPKRNSRKPPKFCTPSSTPSKQACSNDDLGNVTRLGRRRSMLHL